MLISKQTNKAYTRGIFQRQTHDEKSTTHPPRTPRALCDTVRHCLTHRVKALLAIVAVAAVATPEILANTMRNGSVLLLLLLLLMPRCLHLALHLTVAVALALAVAGKRVGVLRVRLQVVRHVALVALAARAFAEIFADQGRALPTLRRVLSGRLMMRLLVRSSVTTLLWWWMIGRCRLDVWVIELTCGAPRAAARV